MNIKILTSPSNDPVARKQLSNGEKHMSDTKSMFKRKSEEPSIKIDIMEW